MKSTDHVAPGDDTVLERNVNSLLEKSYDPPRLDDQTRARMRGQLIAKHAVARRASTPLYAIGFGLAAAAAVAVVAGALLGKDHPAGVTRQDGREVALADGSTVLLDKGATVDVLGPRRVRVVGAALLDIAPGKGTFTVETRHGTMAVLGTRFVVDAEMLRTVTAVIRGSVRLESKDGKVVLHAGEQGIAEPGRAPTRGPAPRLSHLASWAKDARTKAEGKDVQPVRNGTLFARDPNFRPGQTFPASEFPLPLAQLTVDAVIDHQVARVALDQTFENPQPQELEGVYRFAIPSDAALQRFAMYVDGVLTESAVVERMRARRIYEELVYRRIDPGLLEWAGAGRLSLRIFPLRAQADKRIMLAYTQSLPRLYDDWTMTVPLPEVDGTVDDVKFNVRVKGCAGCELHSPSHEVKVGVDGEDAIVTYQGRAEVIGDSLVLVARDTRKQTQVASHTEGDHRYLTVRARPDLTGTAREHRQRSWVIVDDVSASRGPLERRAQADVIDSLLRELDEDDRVAVLTADAIVREHAALTRVDDVDRKAVHAFVTADEVGGVGATDLGKAFDRATAILTGVDPRDAYVLYLGDGVVTGGERGLTALRHKLAGKATFVGVGIGDGVDTPTLAALADATGGSVYAMDLADDLAWRSFDLVASLYTSRVTGLAASLIDARGQVIAGEAYLRAGQLGDGEELELVARVPGSTEVAAVKLTGRRDGAEWQTRIELGAALTSGGGYLPRLWAQRHVAALLLAKEDAVVVPPCAKQPCATEEELRSKHREDIRLQVVALGKKFFLLSRHTSLLVLENDAMYAQYGVTKGAGDTWAPYALPAKVEVKKVAAITTGTHGVDPGASLVRTPIARFYDYAQGYRQQRLMTRRGGWDDNQRWDIDTPMPFATATPIGGGRGGMRMLEDARRESSASSGPMMEQAKAEARDEQPDETADGTGSVTTEAKPARVSVESDLESGGVAMNAAVTTPDKASITTGALAARQSTWMVGGSGTGSGYGVGGRRSRDRNASFHSSLGWAGQAPHAIAFNHAMDQRLDDLTEFVPAMFPGEVEATEGELRAAGGTATGSVDAAARALIQRARKALPDGTYKLGDGPSITVSGGSLGWRIVDDNGLEELARFDGVTWRRAYPELGLEVVRELGTKAPALVLTYLPLLVPDADQLATWFVVTTRGPRTLALAPASDPKRVLLTIELDDHDRVIAIRTASGTEQLAVTWGAHGPTAVTLAGAKSTIGFTPAVDPVAIPPDLVAVSLPLAQQAEIEARRTKLAAGSAEWRAATRQLMASAAATGDFNAQWSGYDALLGNGGVALGDLVLAGRAIAMRQDADVDKALAPFGTDTAARPAPVRYLAAGRAYRKKAKPELLAPPADPGLTATLWRHRHVLALLAANKGEAAVVALEAMGDRGFDLQVIAASQVSQYWDLSAELKGRAWDAVARGELRNRARYEAARALYNKGDYAGAAERFATLLAEIDLTAAPVQLDYTVQGAMQSSPRGMAGFDMAWRGYVSRILADGSYDHVVALASSAAMMSRAPDVDRSLGRAAELATGDRELLIDVLQLAVSLGQNERAAALLPLVLVGDPDPAVERLAMQLAVNQGKPGEAADHLERAIAAEPGPAPLANVRSDFVQLITLRGRVAQLAIGQAKDDAIAALLATSRKWRAIDPANSQIDSVVGELLLGLDRPEEAWRQLSTAIERDPMDGAGWILVAGALERHGRYDQALETWQQALVIDQTNPGPRLRKAQLLYAMGRADEGDAIVKDAAPRKWHDRYAQDAWQLTSLAQQRKLLVPAARPGVGVRGR
jgi:tetratricopeptide (TPR) repeat protein